MILEPPWRQIRAEKEEKEDPHFLLDVFWSSHGMRIERSELWRNRFFVFKIYCFYLFHV